MQRTTTFLFAASLLALSGCQSTPSGQDLPPGAAGPEVAQQEEKKLTGSRFQLRTTDRMLRAMGQQEVRNAMDSAPRPLQSQ